MRLCACPPVRVLCSSSSPRRIFPFAESTTVLQSSLCQILFICGRNVSGRPQLQTFRPTTGARELCTCLRGLERRGSLVEVPEPVIQADFPPKPCLLERKTSGGPGCGCPGR